MPTDEAIDLIETLPTGSLYRAMKNPDDAWTNDQYQIADVLDLLLVANWHLAGRPPEGKPDPVSRPGDAHRRAQAIKKAKQVAATIENTKWEEV